MRHNVVFIAFLGALMAITAQDRQPHIILIVADDLGWNDFGFHGSNQIPTPNIDALAYNGVILDKFYTQQSCSPSRAALLTGSYPIRYGFQGNPLGAGENRSLPLNLPLLPEKLKELGYDTHLVGKWHLGAATKNATPTYRGFDTHFGYWNGYIGYFDYSVSDVVTDPLTNTISNITGFDLHESLKPQWQHQGRYATELFTEKTLEIIENHNEEKPLFLLLAHLAGHTGHDGVELGVPNITRTEETYSYINQSERRRIADIVNLMDDSVGQVVKKLSDKNLLGNSIVIFFSDNGAMTSGKYQNFASSWPLRGQKMTLYEGGVRGSCVIYSPLLEKQKYVNRELMHITDWFPTLYSAAGGNVEDLGTIDGINQWSSISKNETTVRTEVLLNVDEAENLSGILGFNGQYKLINGSYGNKIYDEYLGDDGRGAENPDYNPLSILTSLTNIAINNITTHSELTKVNITHLREEIDLGWSRNDDYKPEIDCTNFCLFDIYKDPSETVNLINDTNLEIVIGDLKKNLSKYWLEMIPQTNKAINIESDPKRCNGTWYTWLDGIDSCVEYMVEGFGCFTSIKIV